MFRWLKWVAFLGLIGMVLVGCGADEALPPPTVQEPATAVAVPTDTAVPPTATPVPPSPTVAPPSPTPVPPSPMVVLPTATLIPLPPTATAVPPVPTAPPAPPATRIQFAPGTTSAALFGSVGAGQVQEFVVGAMGGQTLMVNISVPGGGIQLNVHQAANGLAVPAIHHTPNAWSGQLPVSGDYLIRVTSIAAVQVDFGLNVVIPETIAFQPGAMSDSREGTVQAGQVRDYILRAAGGQWMDVSLTSPGNNVFLTIYGLQDGIPLVRSVSDATRWAGTLPATQDYIIKAVSGGPAANYTLQVTIPQVIRFQPGATSALISGQVSARQIAYYTLRALAGQTMTVSIMSPASDVLLTIYGIQTGDPLVRYVSGATSWSGTLPATQDYMIHAVSVGGDTSFTMEVIIN